MTPEPTDAFEAWERSYPFPPVPATGITGAIVRDVLRAAFAAGQAAATERAARVVEAERERVVAAFAVLCDDYDDYAPRYDRQFRMAVESLIRTPPPAGGPA